MAERRRIVHIITRLEPGGSSTNTVDSCAAQAADSDVVLIAGPHPGSAQLRARLPKEVNYLEIPSLGREISPAADLSALLELRRELKCLAPDIVHTHTSKAGALGRLAAFLAGGKRPVLIHTPHGHLLYGYYGPFKTAVFRLLERFLARFADYLVALTRGEMRESLEAGIGRPSQWRVVHSGVHLEQPPFPASKRDLGIAADELSVGTTARLEPVKGVEHFIRAAALLRANNPYLKVKFVVIGGGPLEIPLKTLAASLGVAGDVIFTGFREDAASLMTALDVYAQPSLNEAMGRAPLEAQAQGVPAVVSAVCGLPSTIREGETGFALPPADPAALAAALERLLTDRPLRARMGANALRWALSDGPDGLPRFGPAAMNAALRRLYAEALASRAG